jgi:hypothetical protein
VNIRRRIQELRLLTLRESLLSTKGDTWRSVTLLAPDLSSASNPENKEFLSIGKTSNLLWAVWQGQVDVRRAEAIRNKYYL